MGVVDTLDMKGAYDDDLPVRRPDRPAHLRARRGPLPRRLDRGPAPHAAAPRGPARRRGPRDLGRAHPLGRRRAGARVEAAHDQHQAVALRAAEHADGDVRPPGRARHRRLRGRADRARPRSRADRSTWRRCSTRTGPTTSPRAATTTRPRRRASRTRPCRSRRRRRASAGSRDGGRHTPVAPADAPRGWSRHGRRRHHRGHGRSGGRGAARRGRRGAPPDPAGVDDPRLALARGGRRARPGGGARRRRRHLRGEGARRPRGARRAGHRRPARAHRAARRRPSSPPGRTSRAERCDSTSSPCACRASRARVVHRPGAIGGP